MITHILLSINTPGIRAHETVAGTKNAGADKKKQKTLYKVGICIKRSFLGHSKFLQWNYFIQDTRDTRYFIFHYHGGQYWAE